LNYGKQFVKQGKHKTPLNGLTLMIYNQNFENKPFMLLFFCCSIVVQTICYNLRKLIKNVSFAYLQVALFKPKSKSLGNKFATSLPK
jgi:hypothetical protein